MNQTLSENTSIHKMQYVLECNLVKIQNMLDKLNSYRCEPTSYECFNRLEGLKETISNLRTENIRIFKSIDKLTIDTESEIVKQIDLLILSFQKLEMKIENYSSDTNKRH